MYVFYIQGRRFNLALKFSGSIRSFLAWSIALSMNLGAACAFVIGPYAYEKWRLSDAESKVFNIFAT